MGDLVPAIDDEGKAILRGLGVDSKPNTNFIPKLLPAKKTDRVSDLVGLLKAQPTVLTPNFGFEPFSVARRRDDQENVLHRYREPSERIRLGSGILIDLHHPDPGGLVDESVKSTYGGNDRGA